MTIWSFQSSMSRGELDPRLAGRIDIQAYYNGLKTASNVLTIPQGGGKRRPGQEYLGAALGDGRLERFEFNTSLSYLLVFTDLKMQIYKEGVLQTNISGSGNDWIDTPWTLEQIPDFDYIQSVDVVIITHEDIEPRTISRFADDDWVIDTIPIINTPQHDYNDASSPVAVSEIQRLTLSGGYADGDTFKIALEGIVTEEITFNLNDPDDTAAQITEQLQILPNTGATGISTTVFSSPRGYEITFAGSSANPWKLVTTQAITASGDIANNTSTATREQVGTARTEDVWSSTRGWQRTCTFHEGRLYFGGSRSRPATVWGSNVNQFFNFNEGRARDDELISATLDTDQLNVIEGIFSNRSLQIFTSGAEFYVRESPVTPATVAVVPQTHLGTRRVRPVSIDGITLFVQRTGKVINQFVYVNEFQSNQTRPVTSLSPHLINNPTEMVTSQGTETSDANYVYILNETGSLTVFNTLISEDVQAFTTWTSGFIESVTVVSDRLYLLVRRVVDGQTVYYIEIESATALTDSAVIQNTPSTDTITGLDHLEGETVDVKADGSYQGEFVVSGGQVTITREADIIEAGLPYTPIIETMPLNIGLQNGPNAASKKRIVRCALHLFESNGIIVNGERITDKTIGQDQFDAPTPQTGFKRIFLLGWSLEAKVTITQTTPMPMTILSIGLEVKE